MISTIPKDPYQRGVWVALVARMNVDYHGHMASRNLAWSRWLSGIITLCGAAAAASVISALSKLMPTAGPMISSGLVCLTAVIAGLNSALHPADLVAKHAGVQAQYLSVAGAAEKFCGRDEHKLEDVEKLEEALLAAESSEAAFDSARNGSVWEKSQSQTLKAAGFSSKGEPLAA